MWTKILGKSKMELRRFAEEMVIKMKYIHFQNLEM